MKSTQRLIWGTALALLGGLVGVSACGGGEVGGSGTSSTCNACAPGDQKQCACLGGKLGVQVCKDDGCGWQACEGCGGGGGGTGGQAPGVDDSSGFDVDDGVGSGDPCGKKVGEYRGVPAYSNGGTWGIHQCSDSCQGDFPTTLKCGAPSADGCGGTVTLRTPNGIAYQCVEYARRFYSARYNQNLKCSGNAVAYWKNADAIFDLKMENGKTTQLPQPDDVIIFAKSAADTVGHIAIVRKVTTSQVFIIQQNVTHAAADASYPLNISVDGSGVVTLKNAGQGLGKYSVVGWLRNSSNNAFDCASSGSCPDDYVCQGTTCVAGGGSTCGDGTVTPPEICDGANLAGQDCQTKGFSGGTLKCSPDCATFDTSGCCTNQCSSAGTTQCVGATSMETCQQASGSCLGWGSQVSCPNGCDTTTGKCKGCVPSCSGKCGGAADGCGGFCNGSCGSGCCSGTTCVAGNSSGACGSSGGACATCNSSQTCQNGSCQTNCTPNCSGKCGGASDGCSSFCNGSCGTSQACVSQSCINCSMQTSPSVGSFTPSFTANTNCTCTATNTSCHTLYRGRVDSIAADGWHANLSFQKADGSTMNAGTQYWITVGPTTPSCWDINGYLTVYRYHGTIATSTTTLSVPNIAIWPDQASYDAAAQGSTKNIFIMTDGSGTSGTATWIEKDALVFTKSCP